MSITNMEKLTQLISAAQASYGSLAKDSLENDLKKAEGGADFANKEAAEFVGRYELVDQQPNTATGFSVTLFHDKIDKKYVFAIRGTGIPNDFVNDLVVSDLNDIRSYGYAANQAVDLYRYWKRLTTAKNESVVYSQSEINKLYLLNHSLLSATVIELTSPEYLSFVRGLSIDKGLGAVSPTAKVDVTGHSLGGNFYTYLIRKGDGADTIVEKGGQNRIKLDKNSNAVGRNVISGCSKNQRWDNSKAAA